MKRNVFWLADSGGCESLHLNGRSLTEEQSKLGHIEKRVNGWYFVGEKEHGPYESLNQVKRAAIAIVHGSFL